jgi:hypothetical protein
MKTCTACGLKQPLTEFYWNKDPNNKTRGGFYHSNCKTCHKKRTAGYTKKRYQAMSAEDKLRISLRRYGLTPERYKEMLEKQDNACAICLKELEVPRVDHDHRCCPGQRSCGECVRGLLCATCNQGLGLLGDSPANLVRAANYLEAYNAV